MKAEGGKRRHEEREDPNAIAEDDGRPPPWDEGAEKAVLSAVILDPAMVDVVEFLRPEHFYSGAHRLIYEACVSLRRSGGVLDAVTVGTWLRERDRLAQIGGPAFLAGVLMAADHVAHAEAYARAVRDAWRVRCAILACRKFTSLGYMDHGTTDEYLGSLEREVLELATQAQAKRHTRLGPLLKRVYDDTALAQTTGRLAGIPRGLAQYDALTYGVQTGTVEVIAARPSVGKSTMGLVIARGIAGRLPDLFGDGASYHGVAYFSLEMKEDECGQRLLSCEGRVDYGSLCEKRLTPDQWAGLAHAGNRLHTLPIVIDDTPSLEIQALRARVRRIRAEMARPGYCAGHPTRLRVVVVDYLQLLKAEGERGRSREQEVSTVSRALKEMAKEEDVAVIALAQLNRDVEKRSGKDRRPQMSDLRESGQIEQDADRVTFLHREELYEPGSVAPGEEGKTEIIVRKNRGGPTGTVFARFSGRYQSFTDY